MGKITLKGDVFPHQSLAICIYHLSHYSQGVHPRLYTLRVVSEIEQEEWLTKILWVRPHLPQQWLPWVEHWQLKSEVFGWSQRSWDHLVSLKSVVRRFACQIVKTIVMIL